MTRCEAMTAKAQFQGPRRCINPSYGPKLAGHNYCRQHARMVRSGIKLKHSKSNDGPWAGNRMHFI